MESMAGGMSACAATGISGPRSIVPTVNSPTPIMSPRMKGSRRRSPKRVSVSALKKRADKVFSLWIRNRDKMCVTCGSRSNLQCGHYVSRSWSALRYDEKNCNAQCVGCNVFKRGNMDEYARFLIRCYGPDILDELAARKKPYQLKIPELQAIIKKYAGQTL